MDQDKWIDYAIEVYRKTRNVLEGSAKYKVSEASIISVFEQACSFDRGERAGQQRKDERIDREKKQEEPPTEKQLRYIKLLDGDPDSFSTKKQASEWIDKHKDD